MKFGDVVRIRSVGAGEPTPAPTTSTLELAGVAETLRDARGATVRLEGRTVVAVRPSRTGPPRRLLVLRLVGYEGPPLRGPLDVRGLLPLEDLNPAGASRLVLRQWDGSTVPVPGRVQLRQHPLTGVIAPVLPAPARPPRPAPPLALAAPRQRRRGQAAAMAAAARARLGSGPPAPGVSTRGAPAPAQARAPAGARA